MKLPTSRRKTAAIGLALILLVGGVAGYTALFTAGAGTTYETGSGLIVSTSVDHDLADQNPYNGSDTVVVDNVSFSSSGSANVTVDQFSGTKTNLSSINASANNITIDPGDKSAITVSGGVTDVAFEDVRLDGSAQITYSADSSGTISVNGLPANTEFAARTASGTVLTSATTSASGSADIPVDAATDKDVQLLSPDAPVIDNSSASPSGDAETTQREIDLSINVSDEDFNDPDDSLDVTFSVDGSEVGTTTLSSNGTASTTATISTGGEISWSANVTDDYGSTVSSDTFTFLAPAELTFRSEQNPSQVLTDVNVSVVAYYGDETERRNSTDGSINLTEFPVDEPIVIRASGENYTTRTAVIESIYRQSNVYLLNTSAETYDVRFDLSDPSGEYNTDDTVLFVERDLELNNSVEWRIIAGDNFGVQGVPVTIRQNERYRLRIRNLETGAETTIGAYTAIQSESVTLSPGSATIEVVESDREYGWSVTENETGQYILFEYFDSADQTESVTLTVHERFNKSNVLIHNTTFTDTSDLLYQEPISANETNTTWMAEIYVDRGGETLHFREPVSGPRGNIIPANLGPQWRSGIGVFVLLITGMMFSQLNRSSGAVATALVGAVLWQIGLLTLLTTGPAIVLAIGISIVYHYRGGPE